MPRWFAVLALLLSSCASSPAEIKENSPLEAPTKEPTSVTQTSSISAQLIQTEDTKRWPHLQKHVGQLLLASRSLQILIPIAPPLNVKQSEFGVISKAYRLKGKEWETVPYLPSLSLSLKNKQKEALQLIGQDISQEKDSPAVVAYYRLNKSGSEDAKLIYRLHETGRLDLEIITNQKEISLELNLAKGLSEEQPIPLSNGKYAGISTLLLPEVFSILGHQAFEYQTEESHQKLRSDEPKGFSLLIGKEANLLQTELVSANESCFSKKLDCLKLANFTAPKTSLRIESPNLKKGEYALWQTAFLYDKSGSFRGFLPLREGEKLEIPLSNRSLSKTDIYISSDDGSLAKVLPSPKNTRLFELPRMKKSSLVLKSDPSKARYVEIKAAAARSGKSLMAWTPEDKTYLVSPNTLLKARWPYSLNLPSGDYSIKIYDGFRIHCEQSITLLPGKKTTMECNESQAPSLFSARAAISIDRAAIPDPLLEASGVSIITSSEKNHDKALTEVPVLAAYDSALGLSARVFPASKVLETGWNALIRNNPERSTLQFFADYVRSHGKDLNLVLDCPPPGFQLAEYHWIAQSLKPDILEVFGCGEPQFTKELLDIATKLQGTMSAPLRFAAATYNQSLHGTRIPAIYLPRYKHFAITHKTDSVELPQVLSDLKEGNYTLGFRTELLTPSKVQRTDKTLNLSVRTSDPVPRKLVVRILDQDERLSEIERLQDKRQTSLSVPLVLKSTSRFLRVEVLAKDTPDDPWITLATSNFFRLDEAQDAKTQE